MSKETVVQVHLNIEQDPSVPIPLVQVGLDASDAGKGDHIVVIATNWAEDNKGAAAVAQFLHTAANAIDAELVRNGQQPSGAGTNAVPQRARFNPRPVVGK